MNFINIVEAVTDTNAVSNVCKTKAENSFDTLSGIVNYASCFLMNSVVPFLMSLSVAFFIWGIFKYFINPDNEEQRKKGKEFMIWGLIALFVIVSMWGIVGILSNTFGIRSVMPQLSQ